MNFCTKYRWYDSFFDPTTTFSICVLYSCAKILLDIRSGDIQSGPTVLQHLGKTGGM